MKTATSLLFALVLILAPVLALSKKSEGMSEAEVAAKCKSEGGCFMVTEKGFKKAMVMSFVRGFQVAKQECRGSL